MRLVEICRHSVRTLPQENLSVPGVELARTIGRQTGPFHLAISSPARRAVETSAAMGYPSARIDPAWAPFPDSVPLGTAWPLSFAATKTAFERESSNRQHANVLLASIRKELTELPDGNAMLIVTHGGTPELVAVAAFPQRDPVPWGGVLRCMEGIRIAYDRSTPQTIEVLRVPDALTRV